MSGFSFSSLRLYLVGCGKMGEALLTAWLSAGIPATQVRARVATAESAARLHAQYGITASIDCAYDNEDVVVWAIKPQILDNVLTSHWQLPPSAPLYLSIAAGKTLEYFTHRLGQEARIIRAMPNTPALIRQGVTTMVASTTATAADKHIAEAMFTACGEAVWLADEQALDVATAIAGSGPAYVFHFSEALLHAATTHGLDSATALQLVRGTLNGSIALAEAVGWQDISGLRRDVTSKGGVTQAALDILMPHLSPLMEKAVAANIARSKTLG